MCVEFLHAVVRHLKSEIDATDQVHAWKDLALGSCNSEI
ncbi:hypothetical protein LT85_4710 [Collimonas arenae]|uniref:Uncharacterized protein n=1 Tax=Collimonas arenae TaxID=279058 RepID=A0A0A1FGH5_9BURK|nr:hypothetical protein LT85_4710 [Collimonas arenae]